MWDLEEGFWREGDRHLAGVDEVGRGPLAGPVVAAAVVLPGPDHPNHAAVRRRLVGLTDSKQLTARDRERFAEILPQVALGWAIAQVEALEIDSLNILRASQQAMALAVRRLRRTVKPDRLLVDGHLTIPGLRGPQTALVKGDGRSMSIAAASVIAKVHRDALMVRLDGRYPGYGFASHMGYPTAQHREAIARLGLCPEHRRSFKPCQAVVSVG
jgi:ribonuclease HII